MRRPLIAGNWKMYKTIPEAVALAREVAAGVVSVRGEADVLVAPPFTALHAVKQALGGSAVALGAQDMHWESEGAFTGAVSPLMLRDAGCTHVILGHSERRQLFGETDEGVARKAERESGRTMEVVERQVERALRALSPDQVAGLVIAYEPVWAIGTGRTATPAQAQELHSFIRKRVSTSHGEPAAEAARILYGGSVKPDNIGALMAEPDIDGALVGGASLVAASFLKIVRYPPA
jgi:triosephosphate isomerase